MNKNSVARILRNFEVFGMESAMTTVHGKSISSKYLDLLYIYINCFGFATGLTTVEPKLLVNAWIVGSRRGK